MVDIIKTQITVGNNTNATGVFLDENGREMEGLTEEQMRKLVLMSGAWNKGDIEISQSGQISIKTNLGLLLLEQAFDVVMGNSDYSVSLGGIQDVDKVLAESPEARLNVNQFCKRFSGGDITDLLYAMLQELLKMEKERRTTLAEIAGKSNLIQNLEKVKEIGFIVKGIEKNYDSEIMKCWGEVGAEIANSAVTVVNFLLTCSTYKLRKSLDKLNDKIQQKKLTDLSTGIDETKGSIKTKQRIIRENTERRDELQKNNQVAGNAAGNPNQTEIDDLNKQIESDQKDLTKLEEKKAALEKKFNGLGGKNKLDSLNNGIPPEDMIKDKDDLEDVINEREAIKGNIETRTQLAETIKGLASNLGQIAKIICNINAAGLEMTAQLLSKMVAEVQNLIVMTLSRFTDSISDSMRQTLSNIIKVIDLIGKLQDMNSNNMLAISHNI
jgi:hypothetical protein